MKTIKQNLKWAAKILSLLILLQSCTVYHKYTSSVDEAIATNNKIKLNETKNSYKFLRLVRVEDEIYGVAKKGSSTSKKLKGQIVDESYEGKYNLIKLNDQNLKDIHLKNVGASTALTIVIPVVIAGLVVLVGTQDYSIDYDWSNQ